MAVPTSITDLSATAASNSPSGSESIGSSLDDYLRGIQAVLRGWGHHKGIDVASATAMTVGSVAGFMHDITGTTEIQSMDTISAGVHKILQFDGVLDLVHNATSFILPGNANITTAAGDVAWFISEGSGNWRCLHYMRRAAIPHQAASDTAPGVVEYAVRSEMETPSSDTLAVTPNRLKYHPGVAKYWAHVTVSGGTPTIADSHNVTSITDTATGQLTITIATDFATTSYCSLVTLEATQNTAGVSVFISNIDNTGIAEGTIRVESYTYTDGSPAVLALADPVSWHVVGFGAQA